MGKNNKARRAAKAKKRAKDRRQPGQGGGGWSGGGSSSGGDSWGQTDEPVFSEFQRAEYLFHLAARSIAEKKDPAKEYRSLEQTRSSVTATAGEHLLVQQVAFCWDAGWQPAELLRRGQSETRSASAGRLVALAIATDNANRRATTLDSRWMAQIERLELPTVDGRAGWVSRWVNNEGLTWPDAIQTIVDTYRAIAYIPRIETLIPPPGNTATGAGRPSTPSSNESAGSDPVLEKIRNLLAKAESSEFEAEATAFTAKAQELMTRHAIDAATVERGASDPNEQPIMIRVMIDPPYVDAKATLLHVVAEANRCRSVTLNKLDMSSVVGFEADLAAVELLFTSLLVQAQSALADAARRAPAGTRVRSQAYRSSFLAAFAHRIGDRLDEINAHVYNKAEAEVGSGFQLVLRDRSAAVADAFDDWFNNVTSKPIRGGYDQAGHAGGRMAADQAQLSLGDLDSTATKADIDLTNAIDLTDSSKHADQPVPSLD